MPNHHPPQYSFTAIGYVETEVPDADIAKSRRTIVSDIVIAPAYEPALLDIEAYSHLIVLFWMNRVAGSGILQTHPRGDPTLPLQGVLAMRGSHHPNPLGLAVVELLSRNGNRLTVGRLDAFHQTPVIDLKPYDDYDSYSEIRVADWFAQRRTR